MKPVGTRWFKVKKPENQFYRNDQDANVRLLATNSRNQRQDEKASELRLGFSTLSWRSIFFTRGQMLFALSLHIHNVHQFGHVATPSKWHCSTGYRENQTHSLFIIRCGSNHDSARSVGMQTPGREHWPQSDDGPFLICIYSFTLFCPLASTTISEWLGWKLTSSDGITREKEQLWQPTTVQWSKQIKNWSARHISADLVWNRRCGGCITQQQYKNPHVIQYLSTIYVKK